MTIEELNPPKVASPFCDGMTVSLQDVNYEKNADAFLEDLAP